MQSKCTSLQTALQGHQVNQGEIVSAEGNRIEVFSQCQVNVPVYRQQDRVCR